MFRFSSQFSKFKWLVVLILTLTLHLQAVATEKGPFGTEFVTIGPGGPLTEPLSVQTTEMTQEQYALAMWTNFSPTSKQEDCPKEFKKVNNVEVCSNYPVFLSWFHAKRLLERLNDLQDGYFYRLPTVNEWAYAACGNKGTFGTEGDPATFAWYDVNSQGKEHPVAQLRANLFGLYDVHGNFFEWTSEISGHELPPNPHCPDCPTGPWPYIMGGDFTFDKKSMSCNETHFSKFAFTAGAIRIFRTKIN